MQRQGGRSSRTDCLMSINIDPRGRADMYDYSERRVPRSAACALVLIVTLAGALLATQEPADAHIVDNASHPGTLEGSTSLTCMYIRSIQEHPIGSNDGARGEMRTYQQQSTAPCNENLRYVHEHQIRVDLRYHDGSNWTECASSGVMTRNDAAVTLVSQDPNVSWPSGQMPCGEGWYATHTHSCFQEYSTSGYVCGVANSGNHYHD